MVGFITSIKPKCDIRREIMMEQRTNVKFCVKLGKTFTKTLAMLREAYGDKALWATYETPELSVKKLRRTKKMCLQKLKEKTMFIIFYDSDEIIHKEFHKIVNRDYLMLWSVLARIGRVCPQCRTQDSWFLLHNNTAYKCIAVRKFFASKSILVLNHSLYSPDYYDTRLLFFILDIKNEAEGKVVRHDFRHPEGFDQDYFDHLKERLSTEFFKQLL